MYIFLMSIVLVFLRKFLSFLSESNYEPIGRLTVTGNKHSKTPCSVCYCLRALISNDQLCFPNLKIPNTDGINCNSIIIVAPLSCLTQL